MHNTTPKGHRKEARGQHGGQGSQEVGANNGQGGTVKLIRQTVEASGFVWGSLGDGGLQFGEGEGDLEAVTFFWGELGQVIQELGENAEVRSKGGATVDKVIGRIGGGDVTALEDGGEEAEDLFLDSSLRRQDVSVGSTDTLEARGAAMFALSSHVKHTSLLLLHQGHMGTQGSPSGNLCIQASDLAAAEFHSGPITRGEGVGEGRGEEGAQLIPFGGEKGGEGAAEGDEEGFGGELPPIRQQGVVRRPGGGDWLPGGGKSRPEPRIRKDGTVKLPVETAARAGGEGGRAATPAVSRRRRKARWSDTVGM
jgi:hypothetical protein